ncbi:MAG: hypothetical protein SOS24_03945 [Clostridia bacterium]|nr:hypothetical protein [Clostridia bacterium]
MKKINKIVSCILTVMWFAANFTFGVYAETEKNTNDDYIQYEARVLYDLGIIDTDMQIEQNMSRAEFAGVFEKFLNVNADTAVNMKDVADVEDEYIYAPSIRLMLDRGYMSLDDKKNFFPGSVVTYADTATALVKALGYEPYVSAKGSNAYGYINVAMQIGIKLAGKSDRDALTYGDVIHLLFSALEVSILEPKDYSSEKIEYTNSAGKTPLSAWRDIYVTQGILYNFENGTASISVSSIGEKSVRIGNEIYSIGKVNAVEFLGYAVKGYYYGGNNTPENELVSVIPLHGKNEITSIDAEDIVRYKDNVLTVNNGNRSKKYDISPSADIIYNGEAVSYENRDKALNIECGNVLINKVNFEDVNSVVIVTAYENYVVGAIDKDKQIVYDKLDNNRKLDLLGDDSSIKFTETNGNIINFESLKIGDVLTVAASLGSKRIEVIRSNQKISGNISERGGEGTRDEYIKIDGTTYYVAKNYRDSKAKRPNLNTPVSVALDSWGKVADISSVDMSGYKIGILKSAGILEDSFPERLYMKIFDRDGKMKAYEAIDRVVIDNYRTKTAEEAKNVLESVTGISVYQPIRYLLNSEGMVSNIDTTYYNEAAGESEQSLRYIWRSYNNDYTTRGYGTDIQYMYWANKNFGRKFFAGQWATLMKLPRQNTAEDKFFITESEWVSGRYYYVDALAVGRDNFCADVVIQYYDATEDSTDGQTIRYGLVTEVIYAMDDDGGTAYRISYIDAYGGGTRTRFVDSNCSITDAASVKQDDTNTYRISEGDFVCFSTDAAEMIVKAKVIYDAETGTWASDLPHIRDDRTEGIVNCNMEVNEMFHGYVLQNGTSHIRLTGEKPVNVTDSIMDSAYVFNIANAKVYKYISWSGKLVAVDASEIIPFEYSDDCSEVVTGDLGGLTPFVVIYN